MYTRCYLYQDLILKVLFFIEGDNSTVCGPCEALLQQARGKLGDCLFPFTQVRLYFAVEMLLSSSHVNKLRHLVGVCKGKGLDKNQNPV